MPAFVAAAGVAAEGARRAKALWLPHPELFPAFGDLLLLQGFAAVSAEALRRDARVGPGGADCRIRSPRLKTSQIDARIGAIAVRVAHGSRGQSAPSRARYTDWNADSPPQMARARHPFGGVRGESCGFNR